MKIDLSGMNILVTGASRGIGRSIAEQLGLAGARLAIHFNKHKRAASDLARKVGNDSEIFKANLGKSRDCFQLFNKVLGKFKRIDVLVNNAGIAVKSPLDLSALEWLKRWNRTMMVNLTATGLLCKAAVNHFMAGNGGRIITIASRAAFRGDMPEYLAYAATKGGMVSLTRSIARGFGKHNIMAFIIAPGYVRTDMAQDFIDEYGEEVALQDISLNRLTKPDDIAPLVVFIASGMADHATGATFDINAGSYFH